MSGQDYYMYSYNSRFSSGMGGGYNQNKMGQAPFQMATSAQHRQFHQMKAQMPSDVLELFKANQISFLKAPVKPTCRQLDPILNTGLNLMEMFQIPNFDLFQVEKPQTKQQRHQRVAKQRKQRNQNTIEQQIKKWNPFDNPNISTDPEKTLLIARLSYKTTQKTLKQVICQNAKKYGIIKHAHIVTDTDGKSRGYGFVEFDSKDDFLAAYKQGNNRKIDGHKVVVDFEKGRTLLSWRPRRFGEGQGNTRMTKSQRQQYQTKMKEKKALQQENRHKEEEKNHERQRSRDRRTEQKKRQKQRGFGDRQRGYGDRQRGYGDRQRGYGDRQRQRRSSRDRRDKEKEKERGKDKKDKKDKKEKKDRQRELGQIDL